MKNFIYLFPLLLLVSHIRESRSYSGGAPDERVCESMLPGHGGDAQSGDSPFIINLSSTDVKGGDSVRITLTSKTGAAEFKGFFTMAQRSDRNLKNTGSGPVGNFQLSSTGASSNAKFVKCGQVGDGAVTHNSGDKKKSVTFDWLVPNEDGDFIILATFVQSFDTFWVKQPSAVIRVKRNAALGEAKPTTTTPKPEKKALSDETTKRLAEFYTGCGETKGCFGTPIGCISERNCDMFTTFRVEGTRYMFQVAGQLPNPNLAKGYVAVGLSFDDKMNDDSVIACFKNSDTINPYSYFTSDYSRAERLPNPTDGMEDEGQSGNEIDGVLFCEFVRTPSLTIGQHTYNLVNANFHILLAIASSSTMEPDNLVYHGNNRVPSPVSLSLSSKEIIGESSKQVLTGKFYNDCGVTKGCFGSPPGCMTSRSCDLFTSFDKDFNFQVTGPLENGIGHVSVGLSFDHLMGTDSVTGCVMENGNVAVKSYYNVPDPTTMGNLIMKDSSAGIASVELKAFHEGTIFCEFRRTPLLNSPDEIQENFNLVEDEYYIIMAKADLVEPDKLGEHLNANDKAVAAFAVNLSNTTTFETEGELLLLKFYSGCGVTKGCFGVPDPCVKAKSCEMLVTFNEDFEFQLHGKLGAGATEGHVSVGLSFDDLMGQDSVTGCVLSEDGAVRAKSYYNVPNDKRNEIMNNDTAGLEGESWRVGKYLDGMLFCEFTRSEFLDSADELNTTFNLLTDEYYVFLARALDVTTGENGKEQLGKHVNPDDRGISPRFIYLNETEIIEKGPDEPIDKDQAEALKNKYYGDCGVTKGCFGLPTGCINSQDCNMFVSFNKDMRFQITGQLPIVDQGHISVGLSFDKTMGDDSVTGCILSNEAVRPISYYNYVAGSRKSNTAMNNKTAGLETIIGGTGQYLDGIVFCEFVRSPKLILKEGGLDHTFNLEKDDYYWMLARAGEASESGLGYHATDKVVSGSAYSLSYIGIVGAKSNILIELHAGLMIIAWLMCASTGMFTARYYKQTHTDFNPLNKAFWFVLHLFCMFTTVFLTLCGGIIIFIEIGGYSSGIDGVGSLHPILGLVLVGLALMQVLIAFFRPHPGTARRTLFNWIHWTIGNSAHIVGIACIFLAKDLTKSGLQRDNEGAYIPVVAGFVVFHVVMHVVMAIHTLWADKQMDTQVKMRSVRPGPMKPSGKSDEAPGTRLRTAILILYLAGCAGVAITLIVLVVSGLNK